MNSILILVFILFFTCPSTCRGEFKRRRKCHGSLSMTPIITNFTLISVFSFSFLYTTLFPPALGAHLNDNGNVKIRLSYHKKATDRSLLHFAPILGVLVQQCSPGLCISNLVETTPGVPELIWNSQPHKIHRLID